jgi:hypothetical protein
MDCIISNKSNKVKKFKWLKKMRLDCFKVKNKDFTLEGGATELAPVPPRADLKV